MVQGPALIFSITDEQYQFYQPDKDGLLILSSNPYFFKFSPDGWQNVSVKNIRNKDYWAIDRTVTIPLGYLGDAAKVVKSITYILGTEAKAYLTICSQKLHIVPGVEYAYYYHKEYRGSIDLSSFTHEGVKVTCRALEDGLTKYLKAGENTFIELPMNVPEAVLVKFDGVDLKNKVTYGVPGVQDLGGGLTGGKNLSTFPFFLLSQDAKTYGLTYLTVDAQPIGESMASLPPYIATNSNWAISNDSLAPISFSLYGRLKFKVDTSGPGFGGDNQMSFFFVTSTGTFYHIAIGALAVAGAVHEFDFETTPFNITLAPGEKLFSARLFFGSEDVDATAAIAVTYDETSFARIESTTKKPATYIPHFTGQYILDKIIPYITENKYTASVSNFLNRNRSVLFTCGDAIRGLKDDNGNATAVMKINLKKWYKFWDSYYSVGLIARESTKKVDIDEKYLLQDRANRIRLNSPEIPPKITLRKDLMWNKLKIGYQEIKNEVGALNGNEAFCCWFEFNNGANNTPGEINKVPEIKADCYEQEIIRIELNGKDTTDNKRDNDLYANYVESTLQPASGSDPAHYLLDRSLNSTATGLIEKDSIWNLRLRTAVMVKNNGGWLRSCMLNCDHLTIAYTTADKNNRVTAGGITDKADINMGSAGNRFFYPISISMQAPAPVGILASLKLKPLSTAEVEIGGIIYTGILEVSEVVLAGNRVSEYEILLDETNDLKNLINYNG